MNKFTRDWYISATSKSAIEIRKSLKKKLLRDNEQVYERESNAWV